jgi:hypothetical protein
MFACTNYSETAHNTGPPTQADFAELSVKYGLQFVPDAEASQKAGVSFKTRAEADAFFAELAKEQKIDAQVNAQLSKFYAEAGDKTGDERAKILAKYPLANEFLNGGLRSDFQEKLKKFILLPPVKSNVK